MGGGIWLYRMAHLRTETKRDTQYNNTFALTLQVTSSLVTAPELIRNQLKAAIPKPDTPRHSESTGGGEGGSQRKLSSEVSPRARESEPLGGRLEETEEGADVDQFGEPRRRQSK